MTAERPEQDPPAADVDNALASLRAVLHSPLEQRILDLEQRLTASESRQKDQEFQIQRQSENLPHAIARAHQRNSGLSDALEPEIAVGVQRVFKNDIDAMAEALYPVLGPAVRRMVASLFEVNKKDSKNPFLVEQLFLIQRDSSLVIEHRIVENAASQDADMVSGMLDAIRSFVADAFHVRDFDAMNALTIGDITVWIEWGPKALLAVVVRGIAPDALREKYTEQLHRIHLEHASLLDSFDGDSAAVEAVGPVLEFEVSKTGTTPKTESSARWLWAATAAVFLCTLIWVADDRADAQRWNSALHALDSQPGVQIVAEDRHANPPSITALRDPDARSVVDLRGDMSIDPYSIDLRWHSYLSDEPGLRTNRGDNLVTVAQQ